MFSVVMMIGGAAAIHEYKKRNTTSYKIKSYIKEKFENLKYKIHKKKQEMNASKDEARARKEKQKDGESLVVMKKQGNVKVGNINNKENKKGFFIAFKSKPEVSEKAGESSKERVKCKHI